MPLIHFEFKLPGSYIELGSRANRHSSKEGCLTAGVDRRVNVAAKISALLGPMAEWFPPKTGPNDGALARDSEPESIREETV